MTRTTPEPAAPPRSAYQQRAILMMRERLAELRRRKSELLERFREYDIREERLAIVFETNFPGEPFLPAPVEWDRLSYAERLTLHFIAQRGGVRKVRLVVHTYTMEMGDIISGDLWAARLTDLKNKGALERTYHGYTIAAIHAERAAFPPEKVPADDGWSQMAKTVTSCAPSERPSWTRRTRSRKVR